MIFPPLRKRDRVNRSQHAAAAPGKMLKEHAGLLAGTFFVSVAAYAVLIYWSS
jgi:hypothetical protein